jgi:hypothetical protein
MSESTFRDIAGYLVDRWYLAVILVIVVVVIAVAWHRITEKLGV